ncbi:MAG: MCE family protein [Actinophytocola sp.]|nr:MCE family protein [Actinophytocola sp.]
MSERRGVRSGLGRFWERARTEPGLARNLVVIAVLIALGSAVGGYFLAHQRFNPPWENKYSVYATFEQAPAVSPGNGQEVRIAGVNVGDIRSTSVSDDGKAVLELRIERTHTVYKNATVVLRPKSPLNEMYVELNPGGPPAGKLAEGGTLPAANSRRPIQVDEVFAHLDKNTRNALTTLLSESDVALAHAKHGLPKGLGELNGVLGDLRPVVTQLNQRRDSLSELITSLSQISNAVGRDDQRLARLAGSLQQTLGTVAKRGQPLDESLAQLPDLSQRLRDATTEVSGLADQLDPTLDNVRNASDELPKSLTRFRESVGQLDGFLDDARPVLVKARPVVANLRPAVSDLNYALGDLSPITQRLDPVTSGLLPYLNDLGAYVYNSNSAFSLTDANRGILRGQVNITPQSVPLPSLSGAPTPGR